MRMAVHYRFVACECPGVGGTTVEIPKGIWPVAGRDPVFALVGDKVLTLNDSGFEKLRREGKAVPFA